MTIFVFIKGADFKAIPDNTFTETIGKNIKGEEVKEYSKKMDQKILEPMSYVEKIKKARKVFQLSPLPYPEPGSNRHRCYPTGV